MHKDGFKYYLFKFAAAGALASAALASQGCDNSPSPVDGGTSTDAFGSTGATSTSNVGSTASTIASSLPGATNYAIAPSVKVIFNKSSFYSNMTPNSFGCGGDARTYYDPQTDRPVPLQPAWLRNVAVDLTNSNALGASNAYGCSLTGAGVAPASNCASFDDVQPLAGNNVQSVLIGGFGCPLGVSGCLPTSLLSDVWTMDTSDVSTVSGWFEQNEGLPPITPPNGSNPPSAGFAWHGGDFDILHNQYYIFGGVTPPANDPTQPGIFSNSVIEVNFEIGTVVSTVYPPTSITSPIVTHPAPNYSGRHLYAGWAKPAPFDSALNGYFPPPPMTGPTFTYGLRRTDSMKSYCQQGTAIGSFVTSSFSSGACQSILSPSSSNSSTTRGNAVALTPAVSTEDANDYYLLMGGMQPNGVFNKNIYVYEPHPFSDDVGTGGSAGGNPVTPLPTGGEWMLMSNVTPAAPGISSTVMSVVDVGIGPNGASGSSGIINIPFITTEVGAARQAGDIFSGWLGRAYHGTSYDAAMNRYYIFGGLENANANIGAPQPATSVVPDIATSDVWVYEPPAVGRRPTSMCWTNQMPDGTPLPSPLNPIPQSEGLQPFGGGPSLASTPVGAGANLGVNDRYVTSSYVFPPGGCLKRFKLDNLLPSQLPPQRFAHGQAFDPDNRLMYVFGGCSAPTTIHGSGGANAGDPVYHCPGPSLRNDLWVYVPPITDEIVPQNIVTSSITSVLQGPYNPLTLLGNVAGSDFWLDHIPLYIDNQITNPAQVAPAPFQALGNWVQLMPSGVPSLPPPRAGASVVFDRAHGHLYVQGGFGCTDPNCLAAPRALNDLWMYSPPNFNSVCAGFRETGYCTAQSGYNQGTWTQITPNLDSSALAQPTERYGGTMALANNLVGYGDDFYTVTNNACSSQGPISSTDQTQNSEFVGAIYIDIDQTQIAAASAGQNLLISLRMLPFNSATRLPAYTDGGIPNSTVNVGDIAATSDQALIRVQFMNDPLSSANAIQSSLQPRFHEFLTGAQTYGDTVMYAAGPNGQVTEKQIFVPLSLYPSVNMIKIERVTGSVKFYEMNVSLF